MRMSRALLLSGVTLMLAMTFSSRIVVAEPERSSANALISGCRELAELIVFSNSRDDLYQRGVCSGMITSLGLLGKNYDVCMPASTSFQQAASVIVQYVDARPQVADENIMPLIIEALKDTWRCPAETTADITRDGPLLSAPGRGLQIR